MVSWIIRLTNTWDATHSIVFKINHEFRDLKKGFFILFLFFLEYHRSFCIWRTKTTASFRSSETKTVWITTAPVAATHRRSLRFFSTSCWVAMTELIWGLPASGWRQNTVDVSHKKKQKRLSFLCQRQTPRHTHRHTPNGWRHISVRGLIFVH